MVDDSHGSQTHDGALAAIDTQGYYSCSGRFAAAAGTPQCLGEGLVAGAPMQIYARLVHGGEQLALCGSESIETCHAYLGRSRDRPARAARPSDLGLAESLGVAIERASAKSGATVALAAADAWAPLFVAADHPTTLQCEQLGAWSVLAGSLVGTVNGAICANAARATQLADEALADPKLPALSARGAAQLPGMAPVRETLDDGSSLSYFPVLVVGHGPVVLWTAILVDNAESSAIIVQTTTTQVCPEAPRTDTARLCLDPKGMVVEVARALSASSAR